MDPGIQVFTALRTEVIAERGGGGWTSACSESRVPLRTVVDLWFLVEL
jgi:hypothetical protein